MKRLLPLLALACLYGCGQTRQEPGVQAPVSISGPIRHVLFIGNSYTSVNNLPAVFTQLAASGHHGVQADSSTPGGYTLYMHSVYSPTLAKLNSQKWDDVILQDQSYMPALEEGRTRELGPGVGKLAPLIRQGGAQPWLYLTWGRQKGLADQGFPDFDSMQAQLTQGYMGAAREENIPVIPAGEAWKTALGHDASAPLWGGDGSHPSIQGTYLTACVFYAALYAQTPEGLEYTAGLSKEAAWAMQVAATETVLSDKARWLLP